MKKLIITTLSATLLVLCYNTYAAPIPGGVASAGLTYIVPDMLVWYNTNKLAGHPYNGYVTNGPILNLDDMVGNTFFGNDHWYQNATVLGDSTFLIAANTFADDGSWDGSTNAMSGGVIGSGEPSYPPGLPNQRNIVIFQPVHGGSPTIGEGLYDDFGNPYALHTMMRQKMGQSSHVAGDKRPGAVNFMTEGMASLWYCKLWHGVDYFNTDGRFSASLPLFATGYPSGNNQDGEGVLYPGWPDPYPAEGVDDVNMSTVQSFTLDPLTLLQTPTSKAWVGPYQSQTNSIPVNICNNIQNNHPPSSCNNGGAGDNWMGYEGNIVALDNGNFVSVVSDPTAFFGGANSLVGREDAVATIFAPDGSVVKDTWWVSQGQINKNVAAYSGGFCVRCQSLFSFYDDDGNLQHTFDLSTNNPGPFQTDRGDHTRLASHILSHYVYLAGLVGSDYQLGIWDARTGQFVTNVVVDSDIAPLAGTGNGDDGGQNAELAVDELDRVCVAFEGTPAGTAYLGQVMARVLKWDGTNVTYLTPTFFPFVDSDNTNNVEAVGGSPKGFNTTTPSVAMTRDAICIAAKGNINSTNNDAGGPDTGEPGTTLYAVISHPAPVVAISPTISVTRSGSDLIVSWDAAAGLFTVQTTPQVQSAGTVWTDATAGNVAPPVTVPITPDHKYVQLIRRF